MHVNQYSHRHEEIRDTNDSLTPISREVMVYFGHS